MANIKEKNLADNQIKRGERKIDEFRKKIQDATIPGS